MSDTRDDFGPCECGQSTIRECAEMPNRHCGLKELSPFDEIEALRAQLQTALDREATTARYYARIAALESDCTRIYGDMIEIRNEVPNEFLLVPPDGGDVKTYEAVRAMAARIAELEAELAGQRMCVNCGKFAPRDHDHTQPLSKCVGPEGLAACTFNLTPNEAWQHWSLKAHELRAENAKLQTLVDASYDEALRAEAVAAQKQIAEMEKELALLRHAFSVGQKMATAAGRVCDLLEAAEARLRAEKGFLLENPEAGFIECQIGDGLCVVEDLATKHPVALIKDAATLKVIGLRIYGVQISPKGAA